MQLLPLAVALSIVTSASANIVYVTEIHYTTLYAYVTATANEVKFTKYVTISGPTTLVTKTVASSSSEATTPLTTSSTSLVTKVVASSSSGATTTSSVTSSTSLVTKAVESSTWKHTRRRPSRTSLVVPTTSSLESSTSSVSTFTPDPTTTLSSVAPAPSTAVTPTPLSTESPAQTTTPTTSSTSAPASSDLSGIYADISKSPNLDAKFAKDTLDAHNTDRALHSAPPLAWSETLYDYAQAYADKFVCGSNLEHSGGQYGENLAVGYSDGVSATAAWYGEGSTYDYSAANTYNHFTQVVWKSSTQVGCGIKDCTAQNWGHYVICSYNPPGNFVGEEAANVLPN